MARYQPKTIQRDADVRAYLEGVEHPVRRSDAFALLEMMERATRLPAKMWGDSLIGFGSYHYKYDSGHEGDFFLVGFAPRKSNLAVYIMPGFDPYAEQLGRLGKHKLGKSCLYINKLADVDQKTLQDIIRDSVRRMKKKYG